MNDPGAPGTKEARMTNARTAFYCCSKMRALLGTRLVGGCLLFWLLAFAFCRSTVFAAEIEMRAECQASGLVRLGDVALIHAHSGAEKERLEAIELFPAPPTGGKNFVRAREVLDLLALRGLKMSQHRLTGASQIEIRNGSKSGGPLTSSVVLRATQRVEDAIAACLRRTAGDDEGWKVEVELEGEQVRVITATQNDLAAEGGKAPWTGQQTFTIVIAEGGANERFSVPAKIGKVPLVVVATRALVPGDVVQRTDVQLAQGKESGDDILFHSLDEVVGQQARRALVEGQPIKQDDVQSPLLVRRGDAVTVFARSAGIEVRTQGRAQEEGSKGDVIVIESLLTRERFMGRVCGIHQVEVFAQTADADAATSTAERGPQALKPANYRAAAAKTDAGRGKQAGGFRLPGQTVPRQASRSFSDARPLTEQR
jgi:flagella basal body P-ring formation protein FlgA